MPYFDSAEVHWLLDDFMIVMQLEGLCIYRLVEGPGVGRMLLGKHLFKDSVTVFEMIVELAFLVALL